MEKDLILHLGFHKSATTSIQRTLVANEKFLNSQNWHYPTFDPYAWHNHNVPLLSLFLENPMEVPVHFYSKRSLSEINEMNTHFHNKLSKAFQDHQRIILSSESSAQLNSDCLIKLKQYLEDFGFNIQVLVFVRSPLSYLTSWTQERIKKGHYIDKTNLFAPKSSTIKSLKEIFAEKIHFYPFEKACQHENGPAGFFLTLLNITDQKTVQFQRKNESISLESALLINYLNLKRPIIIQGRLNEEGRTPNDLIPLFSLEGRKFSLSADEIASCLNDLQQENCELNDILNIEFCDQKESLSDFTGFTNEEIFYSPSTIKSLQQIFPLLKPYIKESVMNFLIEHQGISSI